MVPFVVFQVPHITPQQLNEELQAGRKLVLVDVRNPEERRVRRGGGGVQGEKSSRGRGRGVRWRRRGGGGAGTW
jgi:rhodanese-related sulfurtransferase